MYIDTLIVYVMIQASPGEFCFSRIHRIPFYDFSTRVTDMEVAIYLAKFLNFLLPQ